MSIIYLLCIALFCSTASAKLINHNKQAKKKKNKVTLTSDLLNTCDARGASPTKKTRRFEQEMTWLAEVTAKASLVLSSSPQHQAACWILNTDRRQSSSRGRSAYLQRYSLAVLHYATTKSNKTAWDWKMSNDEPWAAAVHGHWLSTKHHECSWYGVKCSWYPQRKVTQLDLGYLKLDGLLPRELSLLTDLTYLDMHANDYQGVVPHRIVDSLTNLRTFNLHMNGFFGSIHSEITAMTELRELRMFGNYFSGPLPKEMSKLKKLQVLDFYANFLSGTIPSALGELKQLTHIDLHDNDLKGSVPDAICRLPKLQELVVDCLGPNPEVSCSCCTVCCRGLPNAKCVNVKTGEEVG